jgi:hypothetical protein
MLYNGQHQMIALQRPRIVAQTSLAGLEQIHEYKSNSYDGESRWMRFQLEDLILIHSLGVQIRSRETGLVHIRPLYYDMDSATSALVLDAMTTLTHQKDFIETFGINNQASKIERQYQSHVVPRSRNAVLIAASNIDSEDHGLIEFAASESLANGGKIFLVSERHPDQKIRNLLYRLNIIAEKNGFGQRVFDVPPLSPLEIFDVLHKKEYPDLFISALASHIYFSSAGYPEHAIPLIETVLNWQEGEKVNTDMFFPEELDSFKRKENIISFLAEYDSEFAEFFSSLDEKSLQALIAVSDLPYWGGVNYLKFLSNEFGFDINLLKQIGNRLRTSKACSFLDHETISPIFRAKLRLLHTGISTNFAEKYLLEHHFYPSDDQDRLKINVHQLLNYVFVAYFQKNIPTNIKRDFLNLLVAKAHKRASVKEIIISAKNQGFLHLDLHELVTKLNQN